MQLPLSTDTNLVPFLANQDTSGSLTIPIEQYVLKSGVYIPVSLTNPLPIVPVGSLVSIFEGTFVFPNSSSVGTAINVDVPLPAVLNKDSSYKITIINPSASTSLSVTVRNKETLNSTAYYPRLTSFGVSYSDAVDSIVQGLFGESARLVITNNGALGSSGGYTGYIRVRRL